MVKSHPSNDPRPSHSFCTYYVTLLRIVIQYIIRHTVKGSVARAPRDLASGHYSVEICIDNMNKGLL